MEKKCVKYIHSDWTDSVLEYRWITVSPEGPWALFIPDRVWLSGTSLRKRPWIYTSVYVWCRYLLSNWEAFLLYVCTVLQHSKELVFSLTESHILEEQYREWLTVWTLKPEGLGPKQDPATRWPWKTYLSSMYISFFLCKMWINSCTSQSPYEEYLTYNSYMFGTQKVHSNL